MIVYMYLLHVRCRLTLNLLVMLQLLYIDQQWLTVYAPLSAVNLPLSIIFMSHYRTLSENMSSH